MSELSPPYGERLARARRAMAEQGVGALALSIGSELPWLVGYEGEKEKWKKKNMRKKEK